MGLEANRRQKIILEWLRKNSRITVNELSEHFGVSAVTIRRDMVSLAKEIIIVADSTKFNKKSFVRYGKIEEAEELRIDARTERLEEAVLPALLLCGFILKCLVTGLSTGAIKG